MAMTQQTRHTIKHCLIRGLILSVPGILTIWLLNVVFGIADQVVGPISRGLIALLVPDWLQIGPLSPNSSGFLSFLLLGLLLTILGALMHWRWGERMVEFGENTIEKIPGIGFLYRNVRKMAAFFNNEKGSPFERVVMIPYPHDKVYTKAFVAGKTIVTIDGGKEQVLLKVVVPNPPTGIQGILLVPEHLAIDLPMSVEDGLQYYLSLGVVAPARMDLHTKKPDASGS